MTLFLGKKDPIPGRIAFLYRDIFDRSQLRAPPLVFGHIWNETRVPMLGNDRAGNCVWCTQAHLLSTWERGLGKPETQFSVESVLADYSAATGYDPNNPASDQGTVMGDAASYWRRIGIADANGNRHKIEAYVDVRIKGWDEMMQAAYDFGGLPLGIQFPDSAEYQWNNREKWSRPPPWHKPKILGGHAVLLDGRNRFGEAVIVTWDGIIAATRDFLEEFVDEAVGVISLSYLDEQGLNPRGYDRTELMKKLEAL